MTKRSKAKPTRKSRAKAAPVTPPTLDVEIAQLIRKKMTPYQQRESRDMLLRLIDNGGVVFREGPSSRQLEEDARWFSEAVQWHRTDFGGRNFMGSDPTPPRKMNQKEAAHAKKRLEDLRMVAARGLDAPVLTIHDIRAKLAFLERATWLLMPDQVVEILDVRGCVAKIHSDLYNMLKLADQRERLKIASKATRND